MRNLTHHTGFKINPLWHLYRTVSLFKVAKNFIVIEIGRFLPSTQLKHKLYKKGLKIKLGENVSFAYKAMPDLMFPELISIGENSIVGYNATILTHEYLTDEYRIGRVDIGDHTMIGANVTVLPGVKIGSSVKIGAGTVVSKDVPDHSLAYGNPMIIRERTE